MLQATWERKRLKKWAASQADFFVAHTFMRCVAWWCVRARHTLRLIVRGNASVCVRRASRACENCTDRSQVRKTFLYFYHLLDCLCILLPLRVRAELKMHHWFLDQILNRWLCKSSIVSLLPSAYLLSFKQEICNGYCYQNLFLPLHYLYKKWPVSKILVQPLEALEREFPRSNFFFRLLFHLVSCESKPN